jgi:hypothetical protein
MAGGAAGSSSPTALLLTAAEIRAMETVPELVFLSCCHLGKIDSVAAADTADGDGA